MLGSRSACDRPLFEAETRRDGRCDGEWRADSSSCREPELCTHRKLQMQVPAR
jgi:hypothetical protein